MTRVVIQAGHCHRTTGNTGTRSADGFTEQQFSWAVSNMARDLLNGDGYDTTVILADPPTSAYRGQAFVAVHADGNNNPAVRGASVGYRTDEGKRLATAWKDAYRQLGWPSGFRADNYTAALGGYYGTTKAISQGNRFACIIEAGFLTNPAEANMLRSAAGQQRCAEAIRRAINAVLTAPAKPAPRPEEPDDMDPAALVILTYNAILGRNPENLWAIGQWVDHIKAHGQVSFVAAIANSDEAKNRR
jgi:N-acetylmuramoyl-L-alanine amidase